MPSTRREFLLSSAALPLLAATKPAPRPNIVLITADGIGSWMLGCYGNRDFRTPNIDLLAQTGTRFSRSYACTPEAAPSRATLLSGRTPRQLGLPDAPAAAAPPETPFFSDLLAKAGYACGYAGVWDLGGAGRPQHSFSFWQTEAAADADAITARALEFLDGQKAGQPFLLVVGHALSDRVPAKYEALYANSRFENIGRDRQAPNAARGKEAFADIVASLRKAAAAVSFIDDQAPPLLRKLDQRGLRDSTAVIFTSTCGSLMGRHGLWDSARGSEPENMFEEVVGVPMIWAWVKAPPQAVRPEVISLYDLAPTFTEIAGAAPPPPPCPGRSYLRSALNQPYPKKRPWHNQVYGEFLNTRMAQDGRFKLVLRNGGKGPNELYDEVNDAREQTNQYHNPKFITVRDELAGALADWQKTF